MLRLEICPDTAAVQHRGFNWLDLLQPKALRIISLRKFSGRLAVELMLPNEGLVIRQSANQVCLNRMLGK